jgi:cytochrome c oxidase subunit 3
MSVMGVFFLAIYSVIALYLWQQGILKSDWLEEGQLAYAPMGSERNSLSPQKVGLCVFLATAGCVFSLLIAAYFMRQGSPDWQMPALPNILWANYFLLVLASISIQIAYNCARINDEKISKYWLSLTEIISVAFLFGQMVAAKQLAGEGVYTYGNPAASFFFLLTAMHALHLCGGLIALHRTIIKFKFINTAYNVAASVELCAIYWHFLLFIWTLLFMLLLGKGDQLGIICRRILA